MSNLLEIIFENVDKGNLKSILDDVANGDDSLIETINKDLSCFDSSLLDNNILTINLLEVKTTFFIIRNVGIRIVTYEKKIDLELNFQEKDITRLQGSITSKLIAFCKKIAKRNNIANYYAGMDPARDLETRFFTKEKLGPITLTLD